jgi:adenine/guanine phosphoribosyltransferase-like PRPP-binding protein
MSLSGRETGFLLFKEGDNVRVNDDATLAPDIVRGEIGTIRRINRFVSEPAQVADNVILVDKYQQLVKHPQETEILGFLLQVYFPKVGDSLVLASNEVTLLAKFEERVQNVERRLIDHLTDPTQFSVLGDGGLDVSFINQTFDAPFFGDLVRYILRPNLRRSATKVMSPEASGPPLAAVYATMSGLNFVRAVKVHDRERPEVPRTWRGTVIGDVRVPSATKKTEHYFAIPVGGIVPEDNVVIFDDVGFTGRTRKACVQLIEKLGAKVSGIVNIIEKSYGEPDVPAGSRAILGIEGFKPETDKTCSLMLNELLMKRLDNPKIIRGVRYEPTRSLSTLAI